MMREWNIQSPARQCAATGRAFEVDEAMYSVLVETPEGLQRQDFCEEAWRARNDNLRPASFWRTVVRPAPAPREAVSREDARDLLRRLLGAGRAESRNAIFILAVMLERKRQLKVVDRMERDGETVIVYEEPATGDTLLVVDPKLRLDQLAEVQAEVGLLLGAPAPGGTGAAPAPDPAGDAPSVPAAS